jgi:hypothetical protein
VGQPRPAAVVQIHVLRPPRWPTGASGRPQGRRGSGRRENRGNWPPGLQTTSTRDDQTRARHNTASKPLGA